MGKLLQLHTSHQIGQPHSFRGVTDPNAGRHLDAILDRICDEMYVNKQMLSDNSAQQKEMSNQKEARCMVARDAGLRGRVVEG